MNSQAASVAPSARSSTPLLDEQMEAQAQPDSQAAAPEIPATVDEMKCEFIDDTFFSKKGVIVQFVNGNCAGSPPLIGGMRLAVTDIKKVPAYLSRNKLQLKMHAMRYLNAHFQAMQCSIGATESLCADDYGMSFSVASVSLNGAALNPSKRNEGPLFYCLYSGLVEPVTTVLSDWDTEVNFELAHVVNCYIHLLPPSQRRRVVVRKAAEDQPQMKPKPDDRTQPMVNGAKKSKMIPASRVSKYVPPHRQMNAMNERKLTQELSELKKEVVQLKLEAVPTPPLSNPPVPSTSGTQWPTVDLYPDMPDNWWWWWWWWDRSDDGRATDASVGMTPIWF